MPRERNQHGNEAFLHDMAVACQRIARYVRGRSLEDYRTDDMLRSAVER
jgi:uncharacterized protein with HEPN domain